MRDHVTVERRRRGALPRRVLVGLASTVLLSLVARAEKPRVAVRFEIADPAYRANLRETQSAAAEKELASFLVDKLDREVGFLEFSLDPSAYLLRVRLGEPGADPTFSPVSLHFTTFATGTGGAQTETLGTRVVPVIRAIDRETSVEDFLESRNSFVERLKSELEQIDFADLVPELFSAVPVEAAESLLIDTGLQREPVAWIIPYRREDLCMDVGSEVSVQARLPAGVLGVRETHYTTVAKQPFDPPPGAVSEELERLRFRLLCFPPENQEDLDLLQSSTPEDVEVESIFVTLYFPIDEGCGGSIAPAELLATGGGS